ncbi:MAG: helix-turn-helix transcriptional regulator [Acidimicrobiales bacterium]
MDHRHAIELGHYLQDRREALGLSARQLARMSDMNCQTVLRIEHGEFATPGPDKLKALARALQLDLTDVWSMAGYAFDTDLPAPLPYLRAKYRNLPAKELRALSRDVVRVLAEHGIDGTRRPAPGEDETM